MPNFETLLGNWEVFSLSIRPCDFVSIQTTLLSSVHTIGLDTGLSELLVPPTRTEHFNKSLEIQQSTLLSPSYPFRLIFFTDLLASYEVNAQLVAIEEMIGQGAEMQVVLRLLCVASITAGGIKTKTLENIKREFLQVRIESKLSS